MPRVGGVVVPRDSVTVAEARVGGAGMNFNTYIRIKCNSHVYTYEDTISINAKRGE